MLRRVATQLASISQAEGLSFAQGFSRLSPALSIGANCVPKSSEQSSSSSSNATSRFMNGALLAGLAACTFSTTSFAQQSQTTSSLTAATAKDPVILYQYEVCPYCCKVKAALDYFNIPYKVVEVNPLTKAQLKFSEYKKVPVLMSPGGEQLNDSSIIITRICQDVEVDKPKSKGFWSSKTPAAAASAASVEEQEWRDWVDQKFVKLITANIYSSWSQSFQTMKYITETSGSWGTLERALAYNGGAVMMYAIGSRMPKKYGFDGDLRELLYTSIDSFIDKVGERKFMGGNDPNLADLAVFGVIRAVQNTDTYYDMLEHSKVKPWLFRMIEVVGESSRLEDKLDV